MVMQRIANPFYVGSIPTRNSNNFLVDKSNFTLYINTMSEFTQGIVNAIRTKMDDSLLLAIIFFIGHILIAMTVVSIITGASIWEAGAVAIIEPAINSVWFYVLHKAWSSWFSSR